MYFGIAGGANFFKRKRTVCVDLTGLTQGRWLSPYPDAFTEFLRKDVKLDLAKVDSVSIHPLAPYCLVKMKSDESFDEALAKIKDGLLWSGKGMVSGFRCDDVFTEVKIAGVSPETDKLDVEVFMQTFGEVIGGIRPGKVKGTNIPDGTFYMRMILTESIPFLVPHSDEGEMWVVRHEGQDPTCFKCFGTGHMSKDCEDQPNQFGKECRLAAKAWKAQLLREAEDRRQVANAEQVERDRLAEEQAEGDRLAEEQAERDRLAEEQVQRDRLAEEQAERDRLAEEQAEGVRLALEQAERDRLAAAQQAAGDHLAAEQAEQERLATDEQADQLAEHREQVAAAEQTDGDPLAVEQAEDDQAAKPDENQTTSKDTKVSTADEVSDNEVFENPEDKQVTVSKKQAKKERQKQKKKSIDEEKKRKNSSVNVPSKSLRTDDENRRRSLSGGLVPVITDQHDQPQVVATPVNSKILPKSPLFSHSPGTHTISPPSFLALKSAENTRNKITNENRTGL